MRRAPADKDNSVAGQHKAIFKIRFIVQGGRVVGYVPAKSRYGRQQGCYSCAMIAAFSPASVMR
jgi:hypothetical protein